MENNWKILAIALLIVVIVESVFIAWLFVSGTEMFENDIECAVNICADDKYDAYYYDDYEKVCYCYTDNEIIYSEFMD